MKDCLLVILSVVYPQDQSTQVFNSNYSPKKRLSFHNWNQFYKVGSNRMPILDGSRSNWFYSMGHITTFGGQTSI